MENNLEFSFVETGDSLDIFSGMIGVKLSRSMNQWNRLKLFLLAKDMTF